jgi:excinuclease ABC subunit A
VVEAQPFPDDREAACHGDEGNTVIVIEHNLDIIKNAQYIIDMGPEGGDKGGEIVYQGELKGILNVAKSYTAQYLSKII